MDLGTLVLIVGLSTPAQQVPPPLARAREAYNAGHYDEAIALAADARLTPDTADAAAVVFARAHIERYRAALSGLSDADLSSARDALKHVTTDKLTGRDYEDYLIGLGESLYYEDRFNAAADLFALALARDDASNATARDKLFDWWAGALDQQAQIGPEADRKTTYQHIVERADAELALHDRSASATYWLAAAARGADDLERAWGAATAGWVRAPAIGARGVTLRADLDRLVTLAIIPERARRLLPTGDVTLVVKHLTEDWQTLKQRWQ